MRKVMLAMAVFASLAFSQTQTVTYTYSGLPMPIAPDDWDTWSVLSVTVPKSLIISKVTVQPNVQFNGVGDLNVFLWSPAGTRSKLLERNCGGLVNINATFDDSGATMFRDACPAAGSGTYRGNEPLGNSNGENAFGIWLFGVENNGSSKTGTINGFTITISGTPTGPPIIGPSTVVSTASMENGVTTPGDQVALIGANLGPSAGVRADGTTTLPTTLSGTSVTFDGVAAPLYYVSDSVVVAQVPFSLVAGTITRVQVRASSGSSASVPLAVIASKPGVFTAEAGGHGQVKAINQDGTLNGIGSPAAPGSIVALYATGLGPLDPAIPAGSVAPGSPLSKVTLPIAANIGGRSATVTWAGAAPGQIGVYQVNVMVPVGTPSGANRLTISVDGNGSQHGVTLQVR